MKIIEILKQDSRLPIKEISKRTKIRPSTVHQRIKNLVKDGVIEKFTIKANNKKIDQNFIVLMLVKGTTTDYLDSKIIHDDHVKEIFGITGEYDMLLKLKFKDV